MRMARVPFDRKYRDTQCSTWSVTPSRSRRREAVSTDMLNESIVLEG
jgi:hypothetical protein